MWNTQRRSGIRFFMIGCAQDNEQLAAFFEDQRCEYRWLLNRGEDLAAERDFRVTSVRIDRENVPFIRTENTPRGYEVWCGSEELKKKLNRQVRVEIEIETKQLQKQPALLRLPGLSDTGDGDLLPLRGNEASKTSGTSVRNLVRRPWLPTPTSSALARCTAPRTFTPGWAGWRATLRQGVPSRGVGNLFGAITGPSRTCL